MNSLFLRLNLKDLGKGLLLAVFVAALGLLLDILKAKGLDITNADLMAILDISWKTLVGYLAKNLLTNSEGSFGRRG